MKLNKQFAKQAGIFLLFVIGFWLLSALYLRPAIGGDMAMNQGDMTQVRYMRAEAVQYKAENGKYPGWVDGIFGGMPTSLITGIPNGNLVYTMGVYELFHMVRTPFNFLFLAMLSMFILLLAVDVNKWLAAAGGIGFAFMTFSISSYEAGHITKILATNVMPGVLAGLVLISRKKYWLGAAVTATFFALLIGYFHYQIAYYMGIVIGIFLVAEFIRFIKEKEVKHALITMGIGAACLLVGVLSNIGKIVDTSEYAKASIRGGSEVSSEVPKAGPRQGNTSRKGLNIVYAFEYSYGIDETFSLMFPRIKGASMSENVGPNELTDGENLPLYYGNLPIISGPIYIGVVLMFLFIAGMVYIIRLKPEDVGEQKFRTARFLMVFSLISFLISMMLSWGKYFSLNEFLFENLPYYDKFRTPMMALTIAELVVPFFALYALQLFISSKQEKVKRLQLIKYISITTAVVFVGAAYIISSQKYESPEDDRMLIRYMQQENPKQFEAMQQELGGALVKMIQERGSKMLTDFPGTKQFYLKLAEERNSYAWGDFGRSFIFCALCLGLLLLYERNSIKSNVLIISMVVLISFDLIGISNRYLTSENFVDVSEEEVVASPKDQDLMALNKNYGRVYDMRRDPFNDNRSAPFHRNIGGYHPAKIGRYQDVISYCITPNGGNPTGINVINNKALDMLNCAYILTMSQDGSKEELYTRATAAGNAWFVSKTITAADAKSALEGINKFDVKNEAIIEAKEKLKPKATSWTKDSTAFIDIAKNGYGLDTITYDVKNSNDGLAVLSEVYYNEKNGKWIAYVDGKETPVLRVNYILRGVEIPANSKQLKLIYQEAGNRYRTVEMASSGLALLLLAGFFGMALFKKEEATTGDA